MCRSYHTHLFGLALTAVGLVLLLLSAACSPAATPTPAPTATATPITMPMRTPTPTRTPLPTPTMAPNPFATGTQPPPPVETPTPTISVALTRLPAAANTLELERRLTLMGRWEPEHPGTPQALAEGQSQGKRYVFLGKAGRLDLLEIAEDGLPRPTGVSIALEGRLGEMAWEGDTLLAVVREQDSWALKVWSVSDVRVPKLLGSLPDVERLFDVDGRRAYVSGREDNRDAYYLIPDITKPAEAVALEGFGTMHGVYGAGDLAYVMWTPIRVSRTQEVEPTVSVLDVSGKGSPYVAGELKGPFATRGALVDGRLILWGDAWGLSALDVTDSSSPRLLHEPSRGFRTVSTTDIDDSVSMLVDGARLYLLLYGGDWGVYRWRLGVWDISDMSRPKEMGGFEGKGVPAGMWLQGQQVVVADWYGMSVVDVSDPAQPKEVGRSPAGSKSEVFLRGNSAFLFSYAGLFALDLSRPGAPQLAAFRYFGPLGGATDLGGNRFRAGLYGWNKAYEIDLSAPAEPVVEEARTDGPPPPRPMLGPYELLAACGSLQVMDPAQSRGDLAIVVRVRLKDSDCSDKWDVTSLDRTIYVVGNGRLYVLDASDPAAPRLLVEKALGDWWGEDGQQARVLIEGGRAYVLHGGLWVFDLSDPMVPREVAYWHTDALRLDMEGERIALTGPDGTFELLRLDTGR